MTVSFRYSSLSTWSLNSMIKLLSIQAKLNESERGQHFRFLKPRTVSLSLGLHATDVMQLNNFHYQI